jgi:CDGSH-type Zn-finger protein/uncharacterized Fe-S cluster protein YjdI
MSDKDSIEYPGQQSTVSWNGKLCIHIGECGRASGDLFVGGRKPWCQPDMAVNEDVVEVVLRCPTGALSVSFADGSYAETAPQFNTVHVAYNGPLFIQGDLAIDGAPEDVPGLNFRAALCRCGKSKNKPYCDNSHEEAGFKDYGAVGQSGKRIDEAGGQLAVKFAKDGPILLKGNMSIVASSGRGAWSGTQTALCRCGASRNKPFCDGEHKKIGFTSD